MRCIATRLSVVFLAVSAVGCTTPPGVARGDFHYLETKRIQRTVEVPAAIGKVQQTPTFVVPSAEDSTTSFVGDKVDIRPPAQVMPVADGTSLPVAPQKAELVFENVSGQGEEQLRAQLWQALSQYLSSMSLNTTFADPEQGLAITDWHTVKEETVSGSFFGLGSLVGGKPSQDHVIQERFAIELTREGTRIKVGVTMVGYRELLDNRVVNTKPTRLNIDNDTVAFLNGAVVEYDHEVKKAVAQQRQAKRSVTVSLGTGEGGESVVVYDAPFDDVWRLTAEELPKIGFGINDRDQSVGIYYVKYGAERSVWQRIFGGGTDLGLPTDKFEVQLGDRGKTTTLGIFDDDNKPLSADQMSKVYDALKNLVVENRGNVSSTRNNG